MDDQGWGKLPLVSVYQWYPKRTSPESTKVDLFWVLPSGLRFMT